MTPSYLDHVKKVTDAYSNSLKASIIHLLFVYNRLSTTELAEKLQKAKTTVLRHLNSLVEIGVVTEEEVNEGRGRFKTKYFSLKTRHLGLKGSKIRELTKEFTSDEMEAYLRSFQSRYILVKQVMDQSVEYIDRLIEEIHQVETSDKIMELMKDNLGQISFNYETKSSIWKKHFDRAITGNETDFQEYLELSLLLPIRRLIEISHSDEWYQEGNIWPYD